MLQKKKSNSGIQLTKRPSNRPKTMGLNFSYFILMFLSRAAVLGCLKR
jgi:hypothetical protein